MLTYFAEANGYRTAKEVGEFMESMYDGISLDSVYRNLHLYKELGILGTTELNSERHFRMNCAQHHQNHFICHDYGKTKRINNSPMEDLGDTFMNYYIEDRKFEIYGLCPECRVA